MRNKCAIACFFLASISAGTTFANENVPRTLSEMQRLGDEIYVLKLELQLADLRSQIAAKKAESMPKHAVHAPLGQMSLPLPPPMSGGGVGGQGSVATLMVIGLEGVDGNLRAAIAIDGQGTQVVSEGDHLPDGWRVERITENGVSVRKGKQLKSLPFGREPSPAAANGANFPGRAGI